MKRPGFTQRLAMACAHRPWLTIAVWVVLLVACGTVYLLYGDVFTSSVKFLNNPDSKVAADLVREHGGEQMAIAQASDAIGELADGITKANNGAGKLADGSKQLATGTKKLEKGLDKLAGGAGELSSGQAQASSGAGALSAGLQDASTGADSLSSGLGQVSGATGTMSSGLAQLASGGETLAAGADDVASGASSVADGADKMAAGVKDSAAAAGQVAGGADALSGLINSYLQAHPEAADDPVFQQIIATSGQVANGAAGLAAGLDQLSGGAASLASGAQALSTGASKLATGAHSLSSGLDKSAGGAQQLDQSLGKLASGSSQLASGVSSAAQGSQQLAGGAQELAAGSAELASGTRSAADGAGQVAKGSKELSTGANALNTGLTSVSDGANQLNDALSSMGSLNDHDKEVVVIHHDTLTTDDPLYKAKVVEVRDAIAALPEEDVVSVMSAYDKGLQKEARKALISDDKHTTLMMVELASSSDEAANHVTGVYDIVTDADRQNGFRVALTGAAAFGHDAQALAEQDLRRGEAVGVPIALIILVAVFGAMVAAGLPLILSVFAIVIGLTIATGVGYITDISVFALNILTAVALAVGIDYSLFIVSRYREEVRHGHDRREALAIAAATASNAVFFSGMTVVLALGGLFIVPLSIFTSLGVGAMSAVLVAVAAALTLLPAILTLLGSKVDALPVPYLSRYTSHEHGGLWGKAARFTMRRPAISLALGTIVLLAIAAPALMMKSGGFSASTFPDDFTSKQGLEILKQSFPAGFSEPVDVVVSGDLSDETVTNALQDFIDTIDEDERFTLTGVATSADGQVAAITLVQDAEGMSDQARAAVLDLRERIIPAAFDGTPAVAYVGGVTAHDIDSVNIIDGNLPIVIGVVLTLSLILLLLAFRSVLVAVTAIIMNLLSVAAAYGALTLLFQEGLGAQLFGLGDVKVIESWVPLVMFCILFGLSMDYQVFLLSRIRERWMQTGDSYGSVIFGVQSTAGIITGAALIMMAVFVGMGSGQLIILQEFGVGLAIAVFLDAFVVRVIVAPSMISLLGHHYWHTPRWLEWLPRIDIEAAPESSAEDTPAIQVAATSESPG
ncbi:MAG: MMPL family transporter [Thermoleophilia bacterium]